MLGSNENVKYYDGSIKNKYIRGMNTDKREHVIKANYDHINESENIACIQWGPAIVRTRICPDKSANLMHS